MLLREKQSRSVLTNEIERRRKVEQQLHLQATALESAANAIVITDHEGAIIWVNPAFSKLTGYSAEEVLGKTQRTLKSDRQNADFYDRHVAGDPVGLGLAGRDFQPEKRRQPVSRRDDDYSGPL